MNEGEHQPLETYAQATYLYESSWHVGRLLVLAVLLVAQIHLANSWAQPFQGQAKPSLVVKWPSDVMIGTTAVASSRAHAVIAASTWPGGRIALWDASNGKLIRILADSWGAVQCLAFSGDGRLVAAGAEDGRVRLWDVKRGGLLNVLETTSFDYGWIGSVCFSPDSKVIAGSCEFHREKKWHTEVRIWDVVSGALKHVFKGHSHPMLLANNELVTSTTPKERLDGGDRKTRALKLWSVQTGSLVGVLGEHASHVSATACAPGGKVLASASYGEVRFWDLKEARLLRTVRGPFGHIRSIAYSPNGREVAISNEHGSVWLLDVQRETPERRFADRGQGGPAVFARDGSVLIVGAGGVELRNLKDARIRVVFQILPIFSDRRSEWVSYTPEGYYDCSDEAEDFIGWRDGDTIVDIRVHKKLYHRPDLMRRACQGDPQEEH